MIEQSTPQPQAAKPDAAYASWQNAGRKVVMRGDLNDRTAGPMPSFGNMVHSTALAATASAAYAPSTHNYGSGEKPDIAYSADKESDAAFSFGDVIDIINPLQHLPVIGMIYRKITGDEIKPLANIIGGAIFGGPVGAVSGTVNAIVKDRTGRDVAENALAMVGFDAAPSSAAKPDIDYAAPVAVSIRETNMGNAAVAYEKAQNAPRNFAATKQSVYSWNA